MWLEGSLEYDILEVFRKEGSPLSVLEIWDSLYKKRIQVPVLYLNKVLIAMVRFELLEKVGERLGHPAYKPIGNSSRKSFKSLFWQVLQRFRRNKLRGVENAN